MAQNFIACDREQELLLPPSLPGVAAGGAPGVVGDRRGCAAGSVRVLCRLSGRWSWAGGARSGDDGGAVALLLCDRGAVVAADRASLRGGCRLPGDLRQSGAGSLDDRAFSPAP